MAYASGNALSVTALAAAISGFLSGLVSPWTVNRNDAQGTGRRLQVSKGSTFANLRFYANETIPVWSPSAPVTLIAINMSTGFSAGSDWNAQPGLAALASDGITWVGATALHDASNIAYHLFSDALDDNIVICVRLGSIWNYISFGASVSKQGAWTGGQYWAGSRGQNSPTNVADTRMGFDLPPYPPFASSRGTVTTRNSFGVRITADGDGPEWRAQARFADPDSSTTARRVSGLFPDIGSGLQYTGAGGLSWKMPHYGHLFWRSRGALAQNLVIRRMPLTVFRNPSTRFSIIGYHPLIWAGLSRGVVEDTQTITIGADTFRVFGSYVIRQVS